MIRKLSLLLAMVLAMTMVMGIGVTAFAIPATYDSVEIDFHNSNVAGATWNQIKECITITTDPNDSGISVLGEIQDYYEGSLDADAELVEGKLYVMMVLLKASEGSAFATVAVGDSTPINVTVKNVKADEKRIPDHIRELGLQQNITLYACSAALG